MTEPTKPTPPAQLLGPNQLAWIAALRSGRYTQARKALHPAGGGFCCLGVAIDITGVIWEAAGEIRTFMLCEENLQTGSLTDRFVNLYALRSGSGTAKSIKLLDLTQANDRGMSFYTIADMLEASPEEYFTEPR